MNVEPITFALAPSMSIDTIVARRDALVAKIGELRRLYMEMHETRAAIFNDGPETRCGHITVSLEWSKTHRDLERAEQMDEAVKRIDGECWDRLLQLSGLHQLMDDEQRREWAKQIETGTMPPFTLKNIEATFSGLASQRHEIFERGVVNVFRGLSWDFKTNSPVKFGKRLHCRFASERHRWYDRQRGRVCVQFFGPRYEFGNKIDDLIRAFHVLEGKPEPAQDQSARCLMHNDEWMKGQVGPGEQPEVNELVLHDLIRFRGFKNGNARITFLRLDLVDELNRIIAKHYPNALPPTDAA